MLIFNPLKCEFWFSHISETVKVTTNFLPFSRQELFKGIQQKIQIRLKSNKIIILGVNPFNLFYLLNHKS